ncbi:MAG: Fe(3+) ABC transporter substrate-binding protein [Pseudomonadota bacterium]
MKTKSVLLALALLATATPCLADGEVNVYTSRKEALILPLFDRFTELSGIEVRILSANAGALISRLESEGRNSPADVLLTVDAGNLHRAREAGVLRTTTSAALESAIPTTYRDPEGYWFGLSQRARVIFRSTERVGADAIDSYADLADPTIKGSLCIRSSSNIYNQSLVASMIASDGEEATETWARGVVANMARPPQGGDTDQLRAVAAGACDLAVANTYYYGRLLGSDSEDDRAVGEQVAIVWPDQSGRGAHVNVSGAGITTHSPNPDNALALLEFLAGEEAQAWYAEMNHEFPVREGVAPTSVLASWGPFDADDINLSELGKHNAAAVRLMDRAGWR